MGGRCARTLLEGKGKPFTTREVTEALPPSGFKLKAKNPISNVWAAFSHRAKLIGDVERIGTNWRYAKVMEKSHVTQSEETVQMNGAEIEPLITPPRSTKLSTFGL